MPIAMPTPPARPVIHIFNGFQNPYGGSEQEALSLHAMLKDRAEVHLDAGVIGRPTGSDRNHETASSRAAARKSGAR